jgi:hypothetical protein
MDEGALLVYPERVLAGDWPHHDFETFYGPANPLFLAAVYSVLGVDLSIERGVGLIERLILILLIFALALKWGGRSAALAAAVVPITVLPVLGLEANSNYAVLILHITALLALTEAIETRDLTRAKRFALIAGVASGTGTLFRFDLGLAFAVSSVPLIFGLREGALIRYSAGFASMLLLYIPHLAVVGESKIRKIAVDLIESGPGRRLPFPEAFTDNWLRFMGLIGALTLLVVISLMLLRRNRRSLEARAATAIALMGLTALPYALSRLDGLHIITAGLIPVSLLPVAAVMLIGRHRAGVVVAVAVAAIAGGLSAAATLTPPDFVIHGRDSYRVEFEGREWLVHDEALARSLASVLRETIERSRPGDDLFVGPQDLRRTNYNETYIYYLLPELEPASFYLEMNPQTANRDDSGLAGEIATARFLILTSRYDEWSEPNESQKYGSNKANMVVRELFCSRLKVGELTFYERCNR